MAWFFAAGLLMLGAAAVAGIGYGASEDPHLHWLALHLALLGGVSQLVLGAGQFFVCAFLATSPPSRRFVAAHLAVWNVGTVLVAVGYVGRLDPAVDAGALLIAAGLALFVVSMALMQRRSLQRPRWALRWYQGSAACLLAGVGVGVAMAGGMPWPHGSLLAAHLALNLAGWLGTAIVGTLHTFFPSLTQTTLRFARLQGPTLGAWLTGVTLLTLGFAFGTTALTSAGLFALAGAATMLAINLVGSLLLSARPLTLPARLIALGQLFLPAGIVLAGVLVLDSGAEAAAYTSGRASLAVVIVAGWIGLTVAGALIHLLSVLARIRHLSQRLPRPRPVVDSALTAAAGLAVTIWALAVTPYLELPDGAVTVIVSAVTAVLAARILQLALGAMRDGSDGG